MTAAEDRKHEAEAEAALAQAEFHRANAHRADAKARFTELEIEGAQIMLDSTKRAEASELAKDRYFHTYYFRGAVTTSSVERCIGQLTEWSRNAPGCEINIAFSSPGGSVTDGTELYDFIQTLKAQGHHVTTTAMGMCASMAAVLLQAGTVRKMTANSLVMIHEISAGAAGKQSEIADQMELLDKLSGRCNRILAERSKLSVTKVKKMQDRRNVWMDSDDCLKYGFVDEVI